MTGMSKLLEPVFDAVKARNPNEPEFIQATEEILHSLGPVVEAEGGEKYIDGTSCSPVGYTCLIHDYVMESCLLAGLVRAGRPISSGACVLLQCADQLIVLFVVLLLLLCAGVLCLLFVWPSCQSHF